MKLPPFPAIPGVEFRELPHHPGYAASTDRRIWIAGKRGWRPMKPRHYGTGPNSVMLRWRSCGASAHDIDDLVASAFPNLG